MSLAFKSFCPLFTQKVTGGDVFDKDPCRGLITVDMAQTKSRSHFTDYVVRCVTIFMQGRVLNRLLRPGFENAL